MLKYPVTILFLLLTVAQTFSKWCLIAEFRINRDYIAQNLCVNRNKPSCCCKGKCYLNKKLAEDQSQQQTPGKDARHEEIPLQVLRATNIVPVPVVTILHHRPATRHLDDEPQEYIPSFFAPPRETMFFA
ncbi:MAG TPA: hypothetical protein VGQ51_16365 [Puia sp.]|nr:hypothetical protein [Puia sp.]